MAAHSVLPTRRAFLQVGGLSFAGALLSQASVLRAAEGRKRRGKSVIILWLAGGATHIETFSPNMDAPVEFRSLTGAVETSIPGVYFGGTFPRTARQARRMAVVRGFKHTEIFHDASNHYVLTGYEHRAFDFGKPQSHPSIGSIASWHHGVTNPETGVPSYMALRPLPATGPSFLGDAYAPFDPRGEVADNLVLRISPSRLQERQELRRVFDTFDRASDRSGTAAAMDTYAAQATDLLRSRRVQEALDISREDVRVRDRYGSDDIAQQLLLARRLVEAGVSVVTCNYPRLAWDDHYRLPEYLVPRSAVLDQALAVLIDDLYQRGLENDVLVVCAGEFGRTPRINKEGGRDHWPSLSPLVLVGGGLQMGQVVGTTDVRSERATGTIVTPLDLMATMFHVLDIPHDVQWRTPQGRPIYILDGGRPIRELL